MDAIALKAVCAFSKWFAQYERLPFMVVFENYQHWRVCYAGHGISHEVAYNILHHLINTYEELSKYRMKNVHKRV